MKKLLALGVIAFFCMGSDTLYFPAATGAGDVVDVFDCTTGNCSEITATDGDRLDFDQVDPNTADEGIILPQQAGACVGAGQEGQICWDSLNNVLYVGDGTNPSAVGSSTGDITDVFGCNTGDCSSIAATGTDLLDFSSVDAATSGEGILLPTQAGACTGASQEGTICWDSTNDNLYVGDGTNPSLIAAGSSQWTDSTGEIHPNSGTDNVCDDASCTDWQITPGGAFTGTSFTTGATGEPQILLQDSTTNGETAISMTDGAGPDGVMNLQVDVADSLTTYLTLDGINQQNSSTIDFITTGTLRGNVHVITTTTGTDSPTANEMRGVFHIADHATPTSDVVYTLPAAAAGLNACFYDNGGGDGGITITTAAGDNILLNGTATGGDPESIDSPGVAAAGANGDFICLLALDATDWITLGRSGAWVDGTP